MRLTAMIGALSVLALPAMAETEPALARTYVCDGGAVVQVAYLNPQEGGSYAVLGWGGVLVPMQAGITGSGVRYVDFDTVRALVWHTKGAEGYLATEAAGDVEVILGLCIEAGG